MLTCFGRPVRGSTTTATAWSRSPGISTTYVAVTTSSPTGESRGRPTRALTRELLPQETSAVATTTGRAGSAVGTPARSRIARSVNPHSSARAPAAIATSVAADLDGTGFAGSADGAPPGRAVTGRSSCHGPGAP